MQQIMLRMLQMQQHQQGAQAPLLMPPGMPFSLPGAQFAPQLASMFQQPQQQGVMQGMQQPGMQGMQPGMQGLQQPGMQQQHSNVASSSVGSKRTVPEGGFPEAAATGTGTGTAALGRGRRGGGGQIPQQDGAADDEGVLLGGGVQGMQSGVQQSGMEGVPFGVHAHSTQGVQVGQGSGATAASGYEQSGAAAHRAFVSSIPRDGVASGSAGEQSGVPHRALVIPQQDGPADDTQGGQAGPSAGGPPAQAAAATPGKSCCDVDVCVVNMHAHTKSQNTLIHETRTQYTRSSRRR